MVRFVCPSCGAVPDATEEWLRVRSPGTETSPMIQSLLETNSEPTESAVGEETLEPVQTLHPCGHTFPNSSVDTVFRLLESLESLQERHEDTTNPLETQHLRHEIHSVGRRLDAVAQQCADQMETIDPDRCRQWRSEKRTLRRQQ